MAVSTLYPACLVNLVWVIKSSVLNWLLVPKALDNVTWASVKFLVLIKIFSESKDIWLNSLEILSASWVEIPNCLAIAPELLSNKEKALTINPKRAAEAKRAKPAANSPRPPINDFTPTPNLPKNPFLPKFSEETAIDLAFSAASSKGPASLPKRGISLRKEAIPLKAPTPKLPLKFSDAWIDLFKASLNIFACSTWSSKAETVCWAALPLLPSNFSFCLTNASTLVCNFFWSFKSLLRLFVVPKLLVFKLKVSLVSLLICLVTLRISACSVLNHVSFEQLIARH